MKLEAVLKLSALLRACPKLELSSQNVEDFLGVTLLKRILKDLGEEDWVAIYNHPVFLFRQIFCWD